MNQEIETTRPGRRGKEPGQPAGIVVRLPAWLNDALIEHQTTRIQESGIAGNSKEAIIINLLAAALTARVRKEKGAGE